MHLERCKSGLESAESADRVDGVHHVVGARGVDAEAVEDRLGVAELLRRASGGGLNRVADHDGRQQPDVSKVLDERRCG